MEVVGGSDERREVFYTALYHSMIDPRSASDVNGNYVGADGNVHQVEDFTYRTIFSGWDVFRYQFPLQTLINPEMVNASEESILHTPFTASTMTNIKKALACIALATTSVAATQFASQAHSIGYRNHWNYVGQTHSGKTVYAKVRRVHWNYGPKVTYSRLKVKRNGRRRYQTVTAMCAGSG